MGDNGNIRIAVPGTPRVQGLQFRGFRGPADYPAMVSVINGSKGPDGLERTGSVEDVARNYQHLVNCDPDRDMLFAEVSGQVVGYARVWWLDVKQGQRLYNHFAFLLPAWRGYGIRRAMLQHNERRVREIASGHPPDLPKLYQAWAADTENHWDTLLSDEGYGAVRYHINMVRPNLDDIPDLPLPDGLEVRPAEPEHLLPIWEAAREAFRDEWDYSDDEAGDEPFEDWIESPTFQPELWQVAWDGDQVAGFVLNFVDHKENEEYARKRGYTEGIAVRRPWRRRGLARALIARSFRLLRDLGMGQAALGADADNPSGAVRLYKYMGFEVVQTVTVYRKCIEPPYEPQREPARRVQPVMAVQEENPVPARA